MTTKRHTTEFLLRRDRRTGYDTTGELIELGPRGYICVVLEDACASLAVNPEGGIAIPAGRYEIHLAWSSRFKRDLPRLVDVPGRSGILIHSGNTNVDTTGCLLPGISRHYVADTTQYVTDSRRAFSTVLVRLQLAFMEDKACFLTIEE